MDVPEFADRAMEGDVRQRQSVVIARGRDDLVPAQHAFGTVLGVVVAQPHVERGQGRLVDAPDLAIDQF